ncbi:hypothetical protein ACFLUB_00400 [Chloroflexota bacterium]
MRKTLYKLLRGEEGLALPLALAMLAVGSLVVTPLLNLTETALRSTIREERQMYEHYAANAGVMDGIREIITDNPQLPAVGDNWTYGIPDTNNKDVDVIISTLDQENWKINSTATSNDGHSTELDCWVEKKNYLPNAINTRSVSIENGAVVNGNVRWDSDYLFGNKGTINGEIIDQPIEWPTIEEVSAFYLDQVDGAPTHEGNLILDLGPETMGNPYSLGPIHINGDLIIEWCTEGAVRLDGTVYVEGGVNIEQNVNVYMNNNTLFCPGALWIDDSSPVYDYGCMVTGDTISFTPDNDPDACIILWSVEEVIEVGSSGVEIYGSTYATSDVIVKRDSILTYVEPPTDLLLPPPPLPGPSFRIVGWESNSQ